jgi:hypothetical protein
MKKHAKIVGLIDFTKISYTAAEETTTGNSYSTISTASTDTAQIANVKTLQDDLDIIVQQMIRSNPKLAFCTEGRDMSQIYARPSATNGAAASSSRPNRTKTEARFPRLLDPYVSLVLQAGMSKARTNYEKKLKDMIDGARGDLKPSAGGIIDQNICWMPEDKG